MEVKTGEYLITQNSQATHLYCLVEGKLQIERYEINGEHVVFSFEQAFCVIGDLELFSAKSMIFCVFSSNLSPLFFIFSASAMWVRQREFLPFPI
ncbi:cyclic nucleotide-binding domain-containing protein [Proteus terrae]|uniref:cyclic nucleotide-binding domain-containing protein n=1 Tax=Proteus terrae TaxID=1574161 RepID=UPI003B00BEFF